jgi:hypothetical protein
MGSWTMLADDWHYTLWHMRTTRPAIEAIARLHEVYVCSEGDCDRSFDFAYWDNGRLAREYVVQSPRFTDRLIAKNWGAPLPGEAALLATDGCNIGIQLAASLGIQTRFMMEDLRIYGP